MWCNAADAAADDAFAVALPGSSPHWESLPRLFAHLIYPAARQGTAQYSTAVQAGTCMNGSRPRCVHTIWQSHFTLMAEFLLARVSSHYCMHVCIWDVMHAFSLNKHTQLMLMFDPVIPEDIGL